MTVRLGRLPGSSVYLNVRYLGRDSGRASSQPSWRTSLDGRLLPVDDRQHPTLSHDSTRHDLYVRFEGITDARAVVSVDKRSAVAVIRRPVKPFGYD